MPTSATFDTALAREYFDEGFSCRAIAEKLSVAPSTISRWARGEDLRFDRSQTAMAVRAHTIDLAAARLEMTQKLMVSANDALDELDQPYVVYNFGGRDNVYTEHTLDGAPVDARAKVHALAKVAFDAATRIVERDSGGLDTAVGVLDSLAGTLTAAAEMLRANEAAESTDGA
jgi:transcriptional regulator with XRE-family HTH domain